MRRAAAVVLTPQERVTLERLVRSTTSPVRTVRRARVLLLAAGGLPTRRSQDVWR